jgi:hypothetical protein
MSLITTKTPKGTTKGFRVTIQREGKKYVKNFPKNKLEEAQKYHESLLKKLPTIRRPGRTIGSKTAVRHKIGSVKRSIEKNGCIIHRSLDETERCDKRDLCEFYNGKDGCLDAASKRNWPGFTNKIQGGTK